MKPITTSITGMPRISTITRAALLTLVTLSLAHGANVYIAFSGAGGKNGTSPANAYDQSKLATTISGAASGDTVFLEGGLYSSAISISGSGTAGRPKTLMGREPNNLPVLKGITGKAITVNNVSFWVLKNIAVDGASTAVIIDGSSNIELVNIQSSNGIDPFWINNATNIQLTDCAAMRYVKKGFRIAKGGGTAITYLRCIADATGGDSSRIGTRDGYCMGFWYDVNDGSGVATRGIVYRECHARNNLNLGQAGSYANGDGFCGENPAQEITYDKCLAYDNMDGGFDVKSSAVTYRDCISFRNYRGFRAWGGTQIYTNCISGYNRNHGHWSGREATVIVSRCTYAGNQTAFSVDGGTIGASDCIIYNNPSGAGTLTGCITTDPQFVAAVSGWKGTPPDAFNSRIYGNTKGYFYTTGTTASMNPERLLPPRGARMRSPALTGALPAVVYDARGRSVAAQASERRGRKDLFRPGQRCFFITRR